MPGSQTDDVNLVNVTTRRLIAPAAFDVQNAVVDACERRPAGTSVIMMRLEDFFT